MTDSNINMIFAVLISLHFLLFVCGFAMLDSIVKSMRMAGMCGLWLNGGMIIFLIYFIMSEDGNVVFLL